MCFECIAASALEGLTFEMSCYDSIFFLLKEIQLFFPKRSNFFFLQRQLLIIFSYSETHVPNGTLYIEALGMNGFTILNPINPSNAEATFVQSTRMQRFLKTI